MWLRAKNGNYAKGATKQDLYALVEAMNVPQDKLLRLLPNHYELNAIEMYKLSTGTVLSVSYY